LLPAPQLPPASLLFPMPSIAQGAPLKIGLLTVKTGPLAAGGIHFEEGITSFLRDKDFTLSGRKIDLIVADTGGNPAGAKTKAQEVVERDKVDIVLGPFAAFELLATVDYLAQAKMPTLAFCRRRGCDATKGRPLPDPHIVHVGAVSLSACRLRFQRDEAQACRKHGR
jgi:branched-chain amino acid transport system substrate-binding protein